MPPLVLISSTAISVPPFIHTPYEAPEPVSGRMAPILIGCCCARAADAVIRVTERKAARRFSIAGSSPARDADSGRNGNLAEAIQSVGRSQLPKMFVGPSSTHALARRSHLANSDERMEVRVERHAYAQLASSEAQNLGVGRPRQPRVGRMRDGPPRAT